MLCSQDFASKKMNGESSSYDKLESMLQVGSSEAHSVPLEYLRDITNNFSDELLLGTGGFGTVYKGVLKNGEMIAVKKLSLSIPGVHDKQFENEANHLMRLKHSNVVRLVGWCSETKYIPMEYDGKYICAEKPERLICLEYMPKGNLREHLSGASSGLHWDTRFKIIEGICYGLQYLHEKWLVHMDLKPANILLDNNMVPKIADFGLSRLFREEKTWTCTLNCDGTMGYMPPEYINKGLISTKSDIFSLGVIIIEIVTGQREYPDDIGVPSEVFIEMVLHKWSQRERTTILSGLSLETVDYQQIRRCVQIGLDCVKPDRSKRPKISQVIQALHKMEIADTSNIHRDDLESMLQGGSSRPHNLPLKYLRDITNNFSDERLLGEGGCGTVYKGVLQNGETIAVKKINSSIPGLKDRQFENEVNHIMRLKHRNIVRLVGLCSETENIDMEYNGKYVYFEKLERLICLEYMPKGNLRRFLSDESSGLCWDTRYKIIEGICYGLRYLHEEWQINTPIVHMDLKPANILLDNNMVPKIADFGLSRLFSEEKTWTCNISRDGTLGYMSPEYINRGLVSTKSDIFSLGVIIIEIVTGRRDYPYETGTSSKEFIETVLYNWTRRNRMESFVGNAQLEVDYQQIRRCIQIGLDCVKIDWCKRPTISQIIRRLDGLGSDVIISNIKEAAPPPPGMVTTARDACFLSELPNYVLLQAMLAASVTYSATLSPPGGVWPDNDSSSTGARIAGDPVLQVTYASRYGAFFYLNATAFSASIATISLLLVHTLSRHRGWFHTLQAAMILNQLSLMGAYAAGSCRELAMSAYVVVLLALVSSYVFALCALRRRDANASADDVLLEEPGIVERSREYLLIFATPVAAVTYKAGLSTPGGFLSDSQDSDHLAGDPRFMGFFYFNTTAFVASLVVIMLLMSRTVTCHRFRSCALWVCMGAALIGLTGAFAMRSCRSVKTSIYVVALVLVAVLSYIGRQVLVVCEPVANWVHNIQDTLQRYLGLDQIEPQDPRVPAVHDPQETAEADQLLQKTRVCLLLLGIFAAAVTYQAGLNPPGDFWQAEAVDGVSHYLAGYPVLHNTYPQRYLVFFYSNATTFVASLVVLILLLSNISSIQGIKYCALQVSMIIDLLGLIVSYAAGRSCRQVSESVYVLVLVIPVFLYVGIHVMVFMFEVFPNIATWRKTVRDKLEEFVPRWLKKLFELPVDEDKDVKRKLEKEKRHKLLLLITVLSASISYQAGLSPPGR